MSKPKQYIQGYVEFYKQKFKVTPDVLIPRPETELLVDEVLKVISDTPILRHADTLILDIGTGAGNIAISIAKNAPEVQIIATDVSPKALRVAQLNAKYHRVEKQIKFIKSDLLRGVTLRGGPSSDRSDPAESRRARTSDGVSRRQDPEQTTLILVTNLPYIPSARIPYLDSSVKDYEPHVALDGGEDGFGLYRQLFQQLLTSPLTLLPFYLIAEIDYTHGELAVNEALNYFPKAQVEVKTDLAHKQRILTIKSG